MAKKANVTALMSPHVEYRPSPRLPADRYLFGRDGSAWWRKGSGGGTWRRLRVWLNQGHAAIQATTDGNVHGMLLGPLILSAFGDPRPLGYECGHINGNRADCRLDNLVWRPKGHSRRGRGPGHFGVGSQRPTSKLTEEDVARARVLYAHGASIEDLAEEYGITRICMGNAVRGRTWRHVPGAAKIRGKAVWGSAHGGSKLDEIDVAEIKALRRKGETQASVARLFNVSTAAVSDIDRGRSWIHVPDDAMPIIATAP
jgi:hypothetical protein